MIPDHIMLWLAVHFGKRLEWNGPVVFGHGYLWCSRVWFPPQDNTRRGLGECAANPKEG